MCFAGGSSPWQARREAGKGDVEDEAKARSAKLNNSIDNLKDCTTQVLAQVAALAKVWTSFYSSSVIRSG